MLGVFYAVLGGTVTMITIGIMLYISHLIFDKLWKKGK